MAGRRLIVQNYMPCLDANGDPVPGARLQTFDNLTGLPKTTYTSAALTTPHANPVVANSAGVFPSIFADEEETFSLAISDADGAPIFGLRNLDDVTPNTVNLFAGSSDLETFYNGKVTAPLRTTLAASSSLAAFHRDVTTAAKIEINIPGLVENSVAAAAANSAVIQSYIDSVLPTGGKLILPRGVYYFTTLNLDDTVGVQLAGQGGQTAGGVRSVTNAQTGTLMITTVNDDTTVITARSSNTDPVELPGVQSLKCEGLVISDISWAYYQEGATGYYFDMSQPYTTANHHKMARCEFLRLGNTTAPMRANVYMHFASDVVFEDVRFGRAQYGVIGAEDGELETETVTILFISCFWAFCQQNAVLNPGCFWTWIGGGVVGGSRTGEGGLDYNTSPIAVSNPANISRQLTFIGMFWADTHKPGYFLDLGNVFGLSITGCSMAGVNATCIRVQTVRGLNMSGTNCGFSASVLEVVTAGFSVVLRGNNFNALTGTPIIGWNKCDIHSNATENFYSAGVPTAVNDNYGAERILYRLTGANLNTTADQAFTKMGNFSNFRITRIRVENCSGNANTVQGGIYTAANKTGGAGVTLVAAAQTYTDLTSSLYGLDLSLLPRGKGAQSGTAPPILSLTTPQGSTMTADFYVYGAVLG